MNARHAGNTARELRRAAALRWLRTVSVATGDPAAVAHTASLDLTFVNEAFAAQLGSTVGELTGRTLEDIAPDDAASLHASVRLVQRGAVDATRAELRFRRAGATPLPALVHLRAIRSSDGPVEFVGLRAHEVPAGESSAASAVCATARFVDRLAPLFEDATETVAVCERDGSVRSAWGVARAALAASGNLLTLVDPSVRSAVADRLANQSEERFALTVPLLDGRRGRIHFVAPAGEPEVVVVRLQFTQSTEVLASDDPELHTALTTIEHIAGVLWSSGLVAFPSAHPTDMHTLPLGSLSDKERRILFAVARNESVASIASGMYLSPSTVRNYLSSIYAKFGVRNKVELLELMRDRS